MQFEIFLTGKIPSGNSKFASKPATQKLRKQVDEQFRELWECKPLSQHNHLRDYFVRDTADGTGCCVTQQGNDKFVTIANDTVELACNLEIVFYEPSGGLSIKGDVADIDNRMKVLFDILKIPQPSTKIIPTSDGVHYTLSDDDTKFWSADVKRSRILQKLNGDDYLTRLRIELIPTKTTLLNLGLIGVVAH